MQILTQKKRKWIAIAGFTAIALVGGFLYVSSMRKLDGDRIDQILGYALNDPNNSPPGACITLRGPEFPGKIPTLLALAQFPAIELLGRNGLIRFTLMAGVGRMKVRNPNYEDPGPDRPLSRVELTPLGRKFYSYHEVEYSTTDGSELSTESKFCPRLIYGGVEKFSPPFADTSLPHSRLVSRVYFKWKVDKQSAPWLSDPTLESEMGVIGYPKGDDWVRQEVLLKQNRIGWWSLGDEPYPMPE